MEAAAGPDVAFARTCDVLMSGANRDEPVAKPSTQPHLAYDELQAPVLLLHLRSSDEEERTRQALISTRTLLGKELNVAAVQQEAGFVQHLAWAAESHGDLRHRRIALDCLGLLLRAPTALRTGTLLAASSALRASAAAPDAVSRLTAYAALASASDAVGCAEACVREGFVGVLVARVSEEALSYAVRPELLDGALAALRGLIENGGQADAVEAALSASPSAPAPLLETLALHRAAPATLCGALGCLGALCGDVRGKRAVLSEAGSVNSLMDLVAGPEAQVAAAAAKVVMALAVDDDGKRAVLDCPRGFQPLIALLRPTSSTPALIAAATALATLAAHPAARRILAERSTGARAALEEVVASAAVADYPKKTAARALETIVWTP
jgi:hypothetical protein